MKEFKHNLKVGNKIRIHYQDNNPNNILYHVQGFVDNQVIIRSWRKSKKYWVYECLSPSWFYVYSKIEEFKIIRSKGIDIK
jgi:hypothetical protein